MYSGFAFSISKNLWSLSAFKEGILIGCALRWSDKVVKILRNYLQVCYLVWSPCYGWNRGSGRSCYGWITPSVESPGRVVESDLSWICSIKVPDPIFYFLRINWMIGNILSSLFKTKNKRNNRIWSGPFVELDIKLTKGFRSEKCKNLFLSLFDWWCLVVSESRVCKNWVGVKSLEMTNIWLRFHNVT